MTTVIFDARWGGPHGIGRFAREVRATLPSSTVDVIGHHPVSPLGLLESEALPHLARPRGDGEALYLSPGYTPCLSWRGRSAFTVHDLIHLDVADESSRVKATYYDQVVRRAVREPRVRTLTVSQFSRDRIAEWAEIDPEMITVVGNGVDESFCPQGRRQRAERPYVLNVGNTRPHKNLHRLVAALARVPDITLVCSAASDPDLLETARRLGVQDRLVFLSGISEDDLAAWYRGAEAVVIPSLYEGFGLPALEGMACGTPVVASSTTSLGEVVGSAGVLVDPTSADSIAEGLSRVLTDDGLREDLRTAGPRRAAEFSWQAVSERVHAALDLADTTDDGQTPTTPRHEGGTGRSKAAMSPAPEVVVAHDYLTQRGGAERVALSLAESFPQTPVLTSVYSPEDTYPEFGDHNVITSPLNRVPLLRRHFRVGLPLYGWAFDHTPVPEGTGTVVVSTTGFAHGVPTPPGCRKVVYCHSPARFLYLVEDYLGGPWWRSPVGWALQALRPTLVRWDQRAARSADVYLCNSTVVRERIREIYGIEATVVPPPAALGADGPQEPVAGLDEGFFLVVSRLMPYKNVAVVLDAFATMPRERLVVVGTGPLREALRAAAPGNVTFLERVPDGQLRWLYAHAAAVIAPSREDFGLTPVEGFSFGTPALALHGGGYLDTVVDAENGYFFPKATAEAVARAVTRLRDEPLDRDTVLSHAERFTPQAFAAQIRSHVVDPRSQEGQ